MIALTLGLFLVASFLIVLQRCRAVFAANESVARLQDAERHAWSVLVPDIEHAGFYGFSSAPLARIDGLPAGINACGAGFAQRLGNPVEGSNNLYLLDAGTGACLPTAAAGGARAGADTLTVRHASLDTSSPRSGRLQMYVQTLASAGPLVLFANGHAPGSVDADHEVHDLEVHSYYIANHSVDRAGWPALRMKALTESSGAAQFRDEEILPGVEDMQVALGVVRLSAEGVRVQYVAPDSALLAEGRVVAVRMWLRIRADATEPGFDDGRTMTYADVTYTPSPAEARHRRKVFERTVALRNTQAP